MFKRTSFYVHLHLQLFTVWRWVKLVIPVSDFTHTNIHTHTHTISWIPHPFSDGLKMKLAINNNGLRYTISHQ